PFSEAPAVQIADRNLLRVVLRCLLLQKADVRASLLSNADVRDVDPVVRSDDAAGGDGEDRASRDGRRSNHRRGRDGRAAEKLSPRRSFVFWLAAHATDAPSLSIGYSARNRNRVPTGRSKSAVLGVASFWNSSAVPTE